MREILEIATTGKRDGISKLSIDDAQVIDIVIDALSQINDESGLASELHSVLCQYKFIPDEDIAVMLIDVLHRKGLNVVPPTMLNFGGQMIPVKSIMTVTSHDYYDFNDNNLKYCIIFNQSMKEDTRPTSDMRVTFATLEARDNAMIKLSAALAANRIKVEIV